MPYAAVLSALGLDSDLDGIATDVDGRRQKKSGSEWK